MMMICKEVSTLISTRGLDDAPWRTRLRVRLHTSMCRQCRTFKKQLGVLAKAARTLSASYDRELPKNFEAELSDLLTQKRSP